jgi:uncharacterized protein (TIGR02391 family)
LDGIKHVADFPDGAIALQCVFCEGTGIAPDEPLADPDYIETKPCPVCRGTATNIVPASSEASTLCRFCKANGRAWDEDGRFTGEPCPVCGGRGFLDLSAVKAAGSLPLVPDIWSLMHPAVVGIARKRFDNGHFADAVEAALKEFNVAVKQRVGPLRVDDADGASLMTRTFSVERPLLRLADLGTETGRNIQKGYMQLFAGAMTGIRNPKAHENIEIDAPRALHFLFLASLFFFKLDEATQSGAA